MPLAEELQSSGRWLFRWRGYLPLLLLVLFWPALLQFSYPLGSQRWNEVWAWVCLCISFSGAAIRAITVGESPYGTSGRNRKKQRADGLNTTGMYSIVRHPLYLGNFIASLGAFLFLRVWWLPCLYVAIFALYYERIILAEEGFLRERFDRAYLDWADATPAFVPRFKQWRSPEVPFSLRKVLHEEPQTFLAVTAMMYGLVLAGDYRVSGRFEPDPVWNVLLACALAAFVVLRMLRRFTSVLKDGEAPSTPLEP
jgi:protein-S-isoprenylcysteine O-methyltransferase Ste14